MTAGILVFLLMVGGAFWLGSRPPAGGSRRQRVVRARQARRYRQGRSEVDRQSTANRPYAAGKGKKPSSRSTAEIGAPPGAVLVQEKTGWLPGGGRSASARYTSSKSPMEVQLYYTDRLVNDWAILRDKLLDPDGYGWAGVFVSLSSDRVVTIFAESRSIGPAPGGKANPTTISVVDAAAPAD